MTGKVKFFNPDKGFGFIIVDDANSKINGKEVFVHIKNVKGGKLNKDENVEFETEDTPKGLSAIHVTKA